MNPIQQTSPDIGACKAGRVCLSLLAQSNQLKLTAENIQSTLTSIIFAQPSPPPQAILSRLQPVLNLTPHCILTSGNQETLSFLEKEFQGISSDKTFQEAFVTKLFHTTIAQPNSIALLIWRRLHHGSPIGKEEWKEFTNLERIHALMPTLNHLRVNQLFPDMPILTEELSSEQLHAAWKLWASYFRGHWGHELKVYKNMENLALDISSNGQLQKIHAHRKTSSSILRKVKKGNLASIFWEEPRAFLTKHERLASFEKKMDSAEKQIDVLKQNSFLLQAAIFDHLNPILGIVDGMTSLSIKIKETFSKNEPTLERRIFPDKSIVLGGNESVMRTLYKGAIEEWHQMFVSTSVVHLLGKQLCSSIQRNLNALLEKPAGGKIFQRIEAAISRKLAYHSLVLNDIFDFANEEEPSKKDVLEEKKSTRPNPVPKVPVKIHSPEVPAPKPVLIDHFQKQLNADLAHLESPPTLGSITPYMATVAQHLENSHPSEVGDHLFLMAQGLELFSDCLKKKNYECLPVIFRSILIDCHVALEQYFGHAIVSSGKPDTQMHDLAELAQESGIELSLPQKEFLANGNLALYWARYPACSKHYFGSPEYQPSLLSSLISDQTHMLRELSSLFKHTLEIIIPPELRPEQLTKWVEDWNKQPITPFQPRESHSPLRSMYNLIQDALKTCHSVNEMDLTHLEELTYYLPWIEQAKLLKTAYPQSPFRFWHQRNELEVDKLFKHLYATDSLLHDRGDPRGHRISPVLDMLEDIRPLKNETKSFLRSFNMGIAHHYHSKRSPLGQDYPEALKECELQVHGFSTGKEPPLWPHFEKAIELFQSHLRFTLTKLRENNERMALASRQIDIRV